MGPSEVPFEIGRALRLSHGEFEEVSALRYRCGAFDPQRENFAFGISVSFSLSLSLSRAHEAIYFRSLNPDS